MSYRFKVDFKYPEDLYDNNTDLPYYPENITNNYCQLPKYYSIQYYTIKRNMYFFFKLDLYQRKMKMYKYNKI